MSKFSDSRAEALTTGMINQWITLSARSSNDSEIGRYGDRALCRAFALALALLLIDKLAPLGVHPLRNRFRDARCVLKARIRFDRLRT